ncbi:hypothetical protein [Arsenicicoccus dermatophilus]|uniref:hypothetical protein n=1 Tax=Arsenicicoccus dermatophilus TaxID=1076331 RepID=UPI001F4C92B7|nr:hypothetical protein [Arsenicicoccus dermatophilus]MCH8612002.1 hypothetical protein [Arsenicicoccus dermatophilus]
MRNPDPLPSRLAEGCWFARRDLDALGLTSRQRARLARPHPGVYGLRMPISVLEDAQAAELILPGHAAFSHETAARLQHLPLPQRWEPSVRPPIDVVVRGRSRPKAATIRAHRPGRQHIGVRAGEGLTHRVVTPPHVFVELAPQLSLLDLVVLGDAVVGWRSPWRKHHLETAAQAGLPGVVQARRALELVREDANSVAETRTRLLLTGAGVPEPQLNVPVVVDGRWLAFVDLYWPRYRLVVEYYGIHHFATDQQRRDDIHRVRGLRDHGQRVEELTKEDLARPDELVARVVRALREQAVLLGLPAPV